MRIEFTSHAWEDFGFWLEHDPGKVERIRELIKDIRRNPFSGIGKPEALRHGMAGYWSRRIDLEHRLVYAVSGQGDQRKVIIIACRYHY